jgi:hypothetical protein
MNKPDLKAESVVSTAPHVLIAMSAVMEEIGRTGISKDRRNKEQGYSFRGIDDVYNDLNGIMSRNRLLMLPVKMVPSRSEKPTKSGGTVNYTQLVVDFKMASAIDGSTEIIQTIGEAMDSADKSSNKAQSAAMKYAALMVFMIPTQGDNDADATTHQLASMEDRAIAHLKACAIDREMFKGAWESNKDGWRKTMDGQAYARVVKVMKELATAFPKEEPKPVEDFGLADDEIQF